MIAQNNLEGTIPRELRNLINLQFIRLCKLSAEIVLKKEKGKASCYSPFLLLCLADDCFTATIAMRFASCSR